MNKGGLTPNTLQRKRRSRRAAGRAPLGGLMKDPDEVPENEK